MAVALPPPAPRRVSYVLPPPPSSNPPPLLSLPPVNVSRLGHTAPLYSKRGDLPDFRRANFGQEQDSAHPRHRLAVQALALDLSTAVSSGDSTARSDGEAAPDGLLYTGGRDGLLCSWECSLPTKRRRRGYGTQPEVDEDAGSDSDLDDSDDERQTVAAMDKLKLNDLGKRPVSAASTRNRSPMPSGARPRRDSSTSTTRDDSLPVEERWEIDAERVQSSPAPKSTFRQAVQSHTDWINDIVLCNYNRTLVSASSDSLVLAWNPHSSSHEDQVTPMQVGRHGDYVRCLAAARDAHWVASGGFDKKICLWDIGETRSRAVLELPSPPASVYSLTTTPSGSLIAAGTPERVVRVYDPRSRRQVARLGGHTDNVRGVLLGEEGKWLLSASSDSTVKLWSLSAQKCLHTFSHHSSSVWSLFSQHPTLERFYSGDRAGNVCKIDLENTGDPGEGECILLARDGPEDESGSKAGCEGITQLIAQDDSWVWTAGGSSSVKRWRDVLPRSRRAGAIALRPKDDVREVDSAYQELRSDSPPVPESPPELSTERDRVGGPTVSFLQGLTTGLSRTTSSPTPHSLIGASQPGTARPSSLRTRPAATSSASQTSRPSLLNYHHSSSSIGGHSTTLFDIPYDSIVPLTSPEDTYFSPAFTNRHRDRDTASISSISVLSVPQFGVGPRPSASTSPNSFTRRPQSILDAEPAPHPTNIARREYLEREGCGEATPLRAEPDDVIQGRHGLIRCEVLNDRRHVLTLATDEEIALWDIIEGRCLGVFAPDELSSLSRKPSDAASSVSGTGSASSDSVAGADVLEYVRERIEGEAAVATWCKCDTRVGSLTVHLEEARVFDAEVYADESCAAPADEFPPDHRLVLGKWILRHLFDGFIEAEMELRAGGGTPMDRSSRTSSAPNFISLSDLSVPPPLSPATLKSPGMTVALATPALKKALLPAMPLPPLGLSPRNAMWDLAAIPQSPGGTPKPFDTTASRQAVTPNGLRTPTGGRGGEGDYFSLPANEPSPGAQSSSLPARTPTGLPASTPTPGGTLMGRLRQLGKGSKRPTIDTDLPTLASPAPESADVAEKRTIEEQQQHIILDAVFSRPLAPCGPVDAPALTLRNEMALIISEEKDQGAAWAVTYRGLVGTGHADLSALEHKAPMWLLDFLLGNRILAKEPAKISFLIHAWQGDGDDSFAPLPELPNANARLTASRNLRVKKVCSYVADKLELHAASRAPSISGSSDGVPSPRQPSSADDPAAPKPVEFIPEEELEILVGNVLLPLHVTLATARAYYWKTGGDLVVSYRRKCSAL